MDEMYDYFRSSDCILQFQNIFARYGFDTIPSGSLHLVLNSVRQTCPATTKSKRVVYSLNSWKTNKLMMNVNNVLEAFKKARQKMLSVREPTSVSDNTIQ